MWNENGWSCMEKDYFKGHCCYFVWISMLLPDFDPIQQNRMGFISENKGYSSRRGLIGACNPMCMQRDIYLQDVLLLLSAFHTAWSFPPFVSFVVACYGEKKKKLHVDVNQKSTSWIRAAGSLSPDVWVKITTVHSWCSRMRSSPN